MKLTKTQLKDLIIEEYSALLYENKDIVPFDDDARQAIDIMIMERAPELREKILQDFVSSIGRYNRRTNDRDFLKNNMKTLTDKFVGDIIFDYHDGLVGGATLHNLPDFSQDDFEKAHDYIEFHPAVVGVMKEINPIMEFTIKMSQIARNPNSSLKYGISKENAEMLLNILKTDDPMYLIQAYEIGDSL